MAQSVDAFRYIARFECVGAKCEDTCCRGWGMQLDSPHQELYAAQAPELLNAVTSGEAELVMRRDPHTDYCVKFENGLCGIQQKYGTRFLGDACHFYPRITRRFDQKFTMSGALSCPETVRFILEDENPFAIETLTLERLPYNLKNYADESPDAESMVAVNRALITMVEHSPSAERAMSRLMNIALSMKFSDSKNWPATITMMIKFADGKLPKPAPHPADMLRLVQVLGALINASKKTSRPRLEETYQAMLQALGMELGPNNSILVKSPNVMLPDPVSPLPDLYMKRWLQAQIALSGFPYSGLGDDVVSRAVIIGVRFATVKLALRCASKKPDLPTTIRVMQSLSRFLDHLADPTLSLLAYEEAGWTHENRMRALIGDA